MNDPVTPHLRRPTHLLFGGFVGDDTDHLRVVLLVARVRLVRQFVAPLRRLSDTPGTGRSLAAPRGTTQRAKDRQAAAHGTRGQHWRATHGYRVRRATGILPTAVGDESNHVL